MRSLAAAISPGYFGFTNWAFAAEAPSEIAVQIPIATRKNNALIIIFLSHSFILAAARTLSSLACHCQFPSSDSDCHVPPTARGAMVGNGSTLPWSALRRCLGSAGCVAHRCRTPITRFAKLSRSAITAIT
jgi:hypothetical protein